MVQGHFPGTGGRRKAWTVPAEAGGLAPRVPRDAWGRRLVGDCGAIHGIFMGMDPAASDEPQNEVSSTPREFAQCLQTVAWVGHTHLQ